MMALTRCVVAVILELSFEMIYRAWSEQKAKSFVLAVALGYSNKKAQHRRSSI